MEVTTFAFKDFGSALKNVAVTTKPIILNLVVHKPEWKMRIMDASKVEMYRSSMEKAQKFSDVWEIVKDSVKDSLGEHRVGMMLFLDDLPLQLGAYHPLGTNNIVLNRMLVQIVEAATKSQRLLNAFVYNLLVHEYLHALGHVSEHEVRPLVYRISKECFGEDHIVTRLALKSPWTLLEGIPLSEIEAPKHVMEIVKDFERSDQKYIV